VNPIAADDPRREVREVAMALVCHSCGLLFTGDPKDDTGCPLCHSEEIGRADD